MEKINIQKQFTALYLSIDKDFQSLHLTCTREKYEEVAKKVDQFYKLSLQHDNNNEYENIVKKLQTSLLLIKETLGPSESEKKALEKFNELQQDFPSKSEGNNQFESCIIQ